MPMPVQRTRTLLARLIALAFLVASWAAAPAQQNAPLSRQGGRVRAKVESLAPQARISVVRMGAEEEFGTLLSHDGESFTLYDIDLKRNVALRYDEVKKVKSGYGGYNPVQKRHTDNTHALIVVLGVVGAIVGLIAVLAIQKG